MNFPLLFGERSNAIFDLWSLQHCMSGVILGALITTIKPSLKKRRIVFFAYILTVAYLWELLELTMELGWFGHSIASWKGGFEHWGNRLMGDPVMVLIGGFISLKLTKVWRWISIPAILWAIVNVAAPHSMYIQRLVFDSVFYR